MYIITCLCTDWLVTLVILHVFGLGTKILCIVNTNVLMYYKCNVYHYMFMYRLACNTSYITCVRTWYKNFMHSKYKCINVL